ncbi:helix-turn-helix domain-containing protein [Marinobacter halodurans]
MNIKQWRARMKWSQREAARQLGLTLKGYQELERGTRFATGEPCHVDRRTKLACLYLESDPGSHLPED